MMVGLNFGLDRWESAYNEGDLIYTQKTGYNS